MTVYIAENPKNSAEIEKILTETDKDLKNIDHLNISRVFNLLEDEFTNYVKSEFVNTSSQLDILIDLISREGNAIMKQDWFARLYEEELKDLKRKIKTFKNNLESEKSEISDRRKRDYKIYKKCLHTAYYNDEANNQDKKITTDELSILITLAHELKLSQEEVKLINYQILPVEKMPVDDVINELKSIGVIFYSRKNSTIYVADEMVRILRKVRDKEVADKYFRRVLRSLKEPHINLICRKHGVDWRGEAVDRKIKSIINEGIPFTGVLEEDIYKDGTTLNEKKKFINELCDEKLNIDPKIRGTVLEEKVANLIEYFEELEKDHRIGISMDGYDRMLIDLGEELPKVKDTLKKEFQFQEENVLKGHFLLDFNIKPRDVLELISDDELKKFCESKNIKTRGDLIYNILDNYKCESRVKKGGE